MQGAGAGMADNPFGGGAATQSTALTLANQQAAMGMPVTLPNGTQIRVTSQADAQLLQSWWQNQQQQQSQGLTLGGAGGMSGSSSSGTTRALEMAADGAQALSGFLAGRDLNSKVQDYDRAQEDLDRLRDELSRTSAPVTTQQLARFIELQQELNDSQVAVLETQISALDIQAGAGVAKIVGRFMDGSGNSGGGGGGGAVARAAAGVGGALLLTRDSRDRRRRR
jgi:hypothetical protein